MKEYSDDFYVEAKLKSLTISHGHRLIVAMLWRIAKALEKK
jgi:hypothetical protein